MRQLGMVFRNRYMEHVLVFPLARIWHVELLFQPNGRPVALLIERQPRRPVIRQWSVRRLQKVLEYMQKRPTRPSTRMVLVILTKY